MPSIPLAQADRRRSSAQEADVLLRNRFVEANPVLSDNGPAFIARPGLRWWKNVGTSGPIRAIFSQPGAFDDDLFVVAYNSLYRVDRGDGTATLITSGLKGGDSNDSVRMCATGDIGTIGPRLWIADGRSLFCYMDDGFAQGHFSATAISDGDTVRIGDVYYRYSTGSLDSSSPAGTSANPWRVQIETALIDSYTNLYKAINATGTAGTTYSTDLTANEDAVGMAATSLGLYVRAAVSGTDGNAVVTTETGSAMAWDAATLEDGGDPGIITVPVPLDIGVLDVGNINNYVIVIPAQGEGINGRFYWINPGETEIDPLDFATAERSADPIFQVVVFGDQFWLPGQNTTEAYYMTGNTDAPVARFQGVLFDRGTQPGTAIQISDSMVLVDRFGGVFQFKGGEKRISTPDIEERLRKAIARKNFLLGS